MKVNKILDYLGDLAIYLQNKKTKSFEQKFETHYFANKIWDFKFFLEFLKNEEIIKDFEKEVKL